MTPRGSTILGRAQELALLDTQLDRARAAPAEPVLLVGEAGMGKSALLDALARRGRGRRMDVVRTRSPDGADAIPFALVEDVARCWPEDLGQLSPADAQLLRRAGRDSPSRPGSVASALLELLAESAHRHPILLLLDDLQWADQDSVAALCLAVGRLQSERVAVVGAARPRPLLHPGLRDWDVVAIGPLEMDAAVDVLRAHLPDSMGTALSADETRLRTLAERLGRCPLALVEAGRLLSPEQLLGAAPMPDPMPIDEHLLTAWGTAWARLDPPARTAMLALCVTGGNARRCSRPTA